MKKSFDLELEDVVVLNEGVKLILRNRMKNAAVCFSDSFSNFFPNTPILHAGISKLNYPSNYEDRAKTNYHDQKWYVEIYGTELSSMRETVPYINFSHQLKPRRYSKVVDVINSLNNDFPKFLKDNLKDNYDPTTHFCRFSTVNNYTHVEVGELTEIKLSDNLKFMLGFKFKKFSHGTHVSTTMPATLDQRDQQLFIHTDFIHPISYGSRKEFIIQEFIHDKEDEYGIIHKRFEPISFIPVAKSYIDTIHIKITNASFQPITIRDSKTILVLYFRRMK